MAGKIKRAIDSIIQQRTKGDERLVSSIRIKMMLKGIIPDKFNENSDDDPEIMEKLVNLAKELGLNL